MSMIYCHVTGCYRTAHGLRTASGRPLCDVCASVYNARLSPVRAKYYGTLLAGPKYSELWTVLEERPNLTLFSTYSLQTLHERGYQPVLTQEEKHGWKS